MAKKENKKEQQLDSFINKITENIEVDRAKADYLLKDLMNEIQNRKNEYRDLGPVAAKYLESLTRCNEQLVKLVGLLKPKETIKENEELNDQDRHLIYEALQDSKNKERESKKDN